MHEVAIPDPVTARGRLRRGGREHIFERLDSTLTNCCRESTARDVLQMGYHLGVIERSQALAAA